MSGMGVRSCLIAVLGSGLLSAAALAADPVPDRPAELWPSAEAWTATASFYFWGSGFAGDVGLFGQQPVDVDLEFKDIINDLKFGGIASGELHNGEWGILADIVYVRTHSKDGLTRAILGVPTPLRAKVDSGAFTASLMGEYRVVSRPGLSVDLMAGLRVWNVDNDIGTRLAAGGAPVAQFSGSDSETWVDPMIGANARLKIADNWSLLFTGMAGGFGAAADLDWSVFAGLGYDWKRNFSTVVGYRAIGVDYRHKGFVYDIVEQGPVFGAALRF